MKVQWLLTIQNLITREQIINDLVVFNERFLPVKLLDALLNRFITISYMPHASGQSSHIVGESRKWSWVSNRQLSSMALVIKAIIRNQQPMENDL